MKDLRQFLCVCLLRLLLLNQFHDVIPGSCIEMVVEDALRYYEGTVAALEQPSGVILPKYSYTSFTAFQIFAAMALPCCRKPLGRWGRRATPPPCSTRCRGNVMKSSRFMRMPGNPVSVCFSCFKHGCSQ